MGFAQPTSSPQEVPGADRRTAVGRPARALRRRRHAWSRGAQELRLKESDRIASVCQALRALGVRADEHEDGFSVHGAGGIVGGDVESHGDHRLAMLGAIAGLASDEGVSVHGFEAAAVSYPGFARDLGALGAVA